MGAGVNDVGTIAGLVKTLSSAKARGDVNAALVVSLFSHLPVSSVTTPLRLAHFMAQAAHECAGWSRFEENLHYSAVRLQQVWPNRFTSRALADRYAGNPEALANFTYANRLGNGPEGSGDGWRYRGRGIFQLTGRENYELYGDRLGLKLVDQPETAAEPETAVRVALSYWDRKGLSPLADRDDVQGITKRIQGGAGGLGDRAARLRTAKRFLGL